MEELKQLAAVPTQIISPRECKPIVSVVQDICLGLYRITKSYVRISERQMFNLLTTNNKFNGILPEHFEQVKNGKYWTGSQVLSMLLPERLNVEMKLSQFKEGKSAEENKEFIVSIKNGQIISGAFDKDVYQSRTKGIVHSVYNEYGPDETRQLYDHTQKLICDWLVYNGFSVGVSDLIVDKGTVEEFKKTTYDMKVKVYEIIHDIHQGKFENNSTFNNNDMFENRVNNILNEANKVVGEKGLANIRDENNRLINMIKSKSKGNVTNVAQMIGCVGQQNVDGRRIPYGFDDRTLPHYTKFDDGPESRGFVENSFIKGLTPQEFFFHAMGGREGLIDTAVQSVTGDTPIIIIEDGMSKYVKIGDWIDGHLAAAKQSEIKVFPEQFNMEYYKFEDSKKVYIPTCDSKGVTSWGELTAITRHDPGAKVFEIKTYSGRSVKIVDTKSLIIWNQEKEEFMEMKTSDVKVGDCVPTSCYLPETPVINEYIHMDTYFPKTKYVYGTEINEAIKLMKEAQGDKFHIPRGWWEANNGITFTTPYSSKAKLQRMTVRSNTENVKDGCIYPFHASRDSCLIPDKFKLDKEFGIFVGLYIAEGSICEKSGHVSIANIDERVKAFVKQWFEKYSITWYEDTREINVGNGKGTTSSVFGNSTILSRFFKLFAGHLAPNKFVPDIAFTAPYEFKIGLLNGYFSGDGCVSKYSVLCSSVSPKLIDGIQMLCSQIGAFGRITVTQQTKNNLGTKNIRPNHVFTMNAHWGSVFADQVECILQYKQDRLNNLKKRVKLHRNMHQYNNVVLDKIIKIDEIDMKDIHKVYDVTVPSTLNFSVASSVICRDTSETGYIQRKFVKAMEDCKVNYDMSVRNAAGVIIQFLYGEDGIDACKLETQRIPYIDMAPPKLLALYNLIKGIEDFKQLVSDDIYKDLKSKEKKFVERYQKHFDQIMEDREHIITKVYKGASETSIMYPVSFHRIITNVQNMYEAAGMGMTLGLSPEYILDTIDALCDELCVTKTYKGNRLMKCLLRCYLSPKQILAVHHLTKNAFDAVVEQVRYRFFESLAQPSEMVGVIAAQSIGEPATQLVLNSVSYDTELLLNRNGVLEKVQIGKFIDDFVNVAKKVEDHPNDTKLAWLDDDITILSCDESGKISWQKVEAVTRHPVVNKDGTDTVLKVKLQSGKTFTATKGKSFLKRINNKIQECDGENLHVGDYLTYSKTLCLEKNVKIIDELDLSRYLPKNEYIYMSQVEAGIKLSKTGRFYWGKFHGKEFTTPYKRSDAFYDTWISNRRGTTKLSTHRPNCIYPMHTKQHIHISHIPENIQLDNTFGFFVGAYIAEGMVCSSSSKEDGNEHHVLIANIDSEFNNRIISFIDRYNIKYHVDDRKINNGRSMTLRIHSIVLAELMSRMFGNGSENKRLPAWMFQAPTDFLKGFIDGYYSGDGSIAKNGFTISAVSVSRRLFDDISTILATRFDIYTKIFSVDMVKCRAQVAKKYPNRVVKDCYGLRICGFNSCKFANEFHLTISYKNKQLERMKHASQKYLKSTDVVPDIITSKGNITCLRNTIKDKMQDCSKDDFEIFNNCLQEDIMYDKVISIEEIANPTPYMYDLTVANTKNFTGLNLVNYRDTFHSAGISSASQAVRGVPRLNELLSVSKNIKSPIMKIFLDKSVRQDKFKCMEIMNNIRTIRFKDIVSESKIYFDPNDFNTKIEEDRGFIDIYKQFADDTDCQNNSPWLLRLKFDRSKLLEFNIEMITLYHVLDNFYDDNISCMFSDDNASQLIMRVKLSNKDDISEDALTDLKALEHNILENVVIKGIKNIERVALDERKKQVYNEELKIFEQRNEWIIYTAGTNLRDVLIHPMVNNKDTSTNDVNEIYEILGIEAARNALYNEIVDVLDSIQVNYRHISLLVDVMTNRGTILSVNRHGINRGDIGPLAKCSFEETTDKLIKAGIFAEFDKINGVSASVMLGQIAPCGTGDVQVVMDEDLLSKMEVSDMILELDDQEYEEHMNCTEEKLSMKAPEQVSRQVTFKKKTDNNVVLLD